jgi:hypothetical protein
LLIMATLDTIPDPPGVNPSTAQAQVLQLHDYTCDSTTLRCDSLDTSSPDLLSFIATDACERYRPTDRIVHTGQPTDPSPPASQA